MRHSVIDIVQPLTLTRTGAKCLPANTIPLIKGCVLHDSHAEVLSIRALNHLLIEESRRTILDRGRKSPYLRWRRQQEMCESSGFQPLAIRDEFRLHMYCSEAPCGDASMELTMCDQDDATPWPLDKESAITSMDDGKLKGREQFSQLGIVRRKPGLFSRILLLEDGRLISHQLGGIVNRPCQSLALISSH